MTLPDLRPNDGYDLKIFAATAVKNLIQKIKKEVLIPAANSYDVDKFTKQSSLKFEAIRRQAAHVVERFDKIIECREFYLVDDAFLNTRDNTESGNSFYMRAMAGNRSTLNDLIIESWHEQKQVYERQASIHHKVDHKKVVDQSEVESESFISKVRGILSKKAK